MTCDYCRHIGEARSCGAVGPEELFECTREWGHDGKHVACGGDVHRMKEWGDD